MRSIVQRAPATLPAWALPMSPSVVYYAAVLVRLVSGPRAPYGLGRIAGDVVAPRGRCKPRRQAHMSGTDQHRVRGLLS